MTLQASCYTLTLAMFFVLAVLAMSNAMSSTSSNTSSGTCKSTETGTCLIQKPVRDENILLQKTKVVDSVSTMLTTELEVKLFPLVQKLQTTGGCCARLAPDVKVLVKVYNSALQRHYFAEKDEATVVSPILQRAMDRAEKTFRMLAQKPVPFGPGNTYSPASNTWLIERIHITLRQGEANEFLNEHTNYSYQINCASLTNECNVKADSVFGIATALDSTFVQLFSTGSAAFQRLHISDFPQYNVRGLMIDLGRRFIPKQALLHQVIDGMAMVRMNVLQLHLNDFCRFAVALPSFPELNLAGYLEGQYSVNDTQEIVSYARDRGIRVVPEVDLPGHASGLLALKPRGLHFCEPDKKALPEDAAKIFDDPNGESRAVLRQLLQETAAAFSHEEGWFHIGGDEVRPSGSCSQQNTVQLQEFLTSEVIPHLGRTVVGWGDMLLSKSARDGEHATGDKAVLVTWQGGTQVREVLDRGHRVIAATIPHHYLDTDASQRPASDFWYDLAREYGIGENDRARFLGGMTTMWTDKYCYKYQCGAASANAAKKVGSTTLPLAPVMFHRDLDKSFEESIAGMIWPRAGVSAAALWNYDSHIPAEAIKESADWLADMLKDIGNIASCPAGCTCDEVTTCGKPLLPQSKILLAEEVELGTESVAHLAGGSKGFVQLPPSEKHEKAGHLLLRCFADKTGHVDRTKSLSLEETNDLTRCFWRGRDCLGVGSWVKNMDDVFCNPPEVAADQMALLQVQEVKTKETKMDVYVINLNSRKDRCQCMANQLASVPHNVYRQEAVDHGACNLGSDHKTLYGDRNHDREKSLFCSNYKVWQRAHASAAEYIMIMEDDVMIRPEFWETVNDFISGCTAFDYVTMDSWKPGGPSEEDRTPACASTGHMSLFRPNPQKYLDYWGTQVQIIRKDYLATMIQKAEAHGMGPLDVWWMMNINDGRSFSWQPGLAPQMDQLKSESTPGCSGSVAHSDIAPTFFQEASETNEGSLARFTCA